MDKNYLLHEEGEEREDHKYVARVEIDHPKYKYRYFYDQKEYDAYLAAVQTAMNVGSLVNKVSSTLDPSKFKINLNIGKETVSSLFNKVEPTTAAAVAEAKQIVPEAVSTTVIGDKKNLTNTDSGKELVDKFLSDNQTDGIKDVGPVLKKAGQFIVDELIGGAAKAVKNLVNKIVDKFDGDDEPEMDADTHADESPDKDDDTDYDILADKFFDSEDEKEDYVERFEYQENEPDFMKDVPDIPEDIAYSKFEDQEKVNEEFDPFNPDTSKNCANCSAAYELRRRGYDVEAKHVEDDYNGSVDRMWDYFEDAEPLGLLPNGSTTDCDEKLTKAILGKEEMTVIEAEMFHKDAYDFWSNTYDYTEEAIEKGITANNPPGSRGFIDVNWKDGGAHSIVYEVNTKGEVIIRDSQTWDEYSLEELATQVNHVRITRTDNLKLKKEILNAVKPNEDKKRKYYADEGYVRYY